jgi:transcriptional regulator with XRE-family HTH domain
MGSLTRLAVLRGRKGWSQAELAEAAGVDPATISDLETGRTKRPRVPTLLRLAEALGVALDDLLEEAS